MPLDHQIDPDQNLLVARVRGEIDSETLLTHLESVKQDARLRPGYRSLFDLREATPGQIDGDVIRRAAEISRQYDPKLGHVRVAVVAPDDVAFGLARMYASLTGELRREVRVFRGIDEGRAWLGLASDGDEVAA